MVRAAKPTPDGHPRTLPTAGNRDFVFVPETQQRGDTMRNSQFPRDGGYGEQRGEAFYPLPPMEMSCLGPADEMITRLLAIFFCPILRNPQLQGCGFGRKA